MHPVLVQDLARDRHLRLLAGTTRGRAPVPPTGLTVLALRHSLHRAERRAAALEREQQRLGVVLAEVEQRARAARARLA